MDIANIRKLANILRDNQLTALELTEGESRIRLERQPAPHYEHNAPEPIKETHAMTDGPAGAKAKDPGMDFNDLKTVTSPLVGVFYAAPAPDAPPYVKVGDRVKKGDILCILEAMKLMNEIASDYDGEIVDISVQNGDVVEFGQTLFKIV